MALTTLTVHRPETKVAFYKALKFWVAFVLALIAAAATWRLLWDRQDEGGVDTGAGTVSYIR